MLDELFFTAGYSRNKLNFVLFAAFVTVVGFFSSFALFGTNSVAQILVITILLMPTVMRVFQKGERAARKEGFREILSNHKEVTVVFFLLFVGVFLGLLLIQLFTVSNEQFFSDAFSYEVEYIVHSQDVTLALANQFVSAQEGVSTVDLFLSNLRTDVLIVALAFVLSFFYGSGGVFLLVLTASIFSVFVIFTVRLFESFSSYSLYLLIVFFLLFLPLLITFMISSIAGGIISKAAITEKLWSHEFYHVIKEGTLLFACSVFLIVFLSLLRVALLYVFSGLVSG